jgi:RNA polymerase sigma-70 factor (ECF subfamily)
MGNEPDFIRKIQEGDMASLKSFFSGFYPQLYRFALKYLKENNNASDLVQESFLKFWIRRNEFNSLTSAKNFMFHLVIMISQIIFSNLIN